MARISTEKAGWAGLGATAYFLVSLTLDLLGLPGDLDRWRVALGQFAMSGLEVALREIALLAGLMLLTPFLGQRIASALNLRREIRRETERAAVLAVRYAEKVSDVLSAILDKGDHREILERLLERPADEFDPGAVDALERAGILELVSVTVDASYGSRGVYRIYSLARPTVERFLAPGTAPPRSA